MKKFVIFGGSALGIAAIAAVVFIGFAPVASEPRAAASAPKIETVTYSTPFLAEHSMLANPDTNCVAFAGTNATNEDGVTYSGESVTLTILNGGAPVNSVTLTPTDNRWVGEVCVDISLSASAGITLEVEGAPVEGFNTDPLVLVV